MAAFIRKYIPHIVVFFSSIGVMVIELVASRLVSKYFGNSLYTWTGVIGTVLGGISLGNFVGGRLSDKHKPSVVIIPLMLVTSGVVFFILILDMILHSIMGGQGSIINALMVFRSVVVIGILFFLPAASLGTISPVMAKYALEQRDKVGRTVGNIYAIASIGSISGTFLAGFVLIPLFDLRVIILIISLTISSLTFIFSGRRVITLAVIAGIISFYFIYTLIDPSRKAIEADGKVLYAGYSQYSFIKVKDLNPSSDGTRERVLIMDGLVHNRHDLLNSDNLLYEYEKIFAAMTDYFISGGFIKKNFSSLTLGGGAMTFPVHLARKYGLEDNTVIEIDPRVVSIAKKYFDVREERGLKIITTDARNYVNFKKGRQEYDIIYLDAFNSFAVPYHLTTEEFSRELTGILKSNGAFIINCVDILSLGGFINAYYNTLRSVFPFVAVYGDTSYRKDSRSTFVLVASDRNIFPGLLYDENGLAVGRKIDPAVLDELHKRNGSLALSDQHAPVESLMAPVFLRTIQ
ncbi:MAG: fused MFS/spermidine synthase [Spirochaetota bacterium]